MNYSRETISPPIEGHCPGCTKLRHWAETAYSRGWQACDRFHNYVVRDATEALRVERNGRYEDNQRLTESLLAAEKELERLKSLLKHHNISIT